MKKKYVYLMVACIQITACNFSSEGDSNDQSDILIKKAYIQEPKDEFLGTDSQAIYFEKAMAFDPIRNGYDSLELRITFAYGSGTVTDDSSRVLIIKRSNENWNAEIVSLIPSLSNDSLFYSKISRRRNIVPKSGWPSLISNLFAPKLLRESFEPILEGGAALHGPVSVLIKLATKSNYTEYRYLSPDFYKNDYWQITDLEEILETLEREVNFKL